MKMLNPCCKSQTGQFGDFGIPIWVTEYDSKTPDVNKRAENLENLYRIAFSHPAVEGIIMWGFWQVTTGEVRMPQ